MQNNAHMIRHFLAALACRFHKTVQDALNGFADFLAGHGIRPPIEIVHHMNGVLGYGLEILKTNNQNYWHQVPSTDWTTQVQLLHANLEAWNKILESTLLSDELLERLLQGPLSDCMTTHVGQPPRCGAWLVHPLMLKIFSKPVFKLDNEANHHLRQSAQILGNCLMNGLVQLRLQR